MRALEIPGPHLSLSVIGWQGLSRSCLPPYCEHLKIAVKNRDKNNGERRLNCYLKAEWGPAGFPSLLKTNPRIHMWSTSLPEIDNNLLSE